DEKIRFYFTNKAIHIASNDYATIKIMNTNLQIIIEEKICPKTTTSIDLSNVSSGIYYLLIFIQNKVAILKILYLT
ncbi:MAG: T9SS type A sorting domain-containing protein, partial [Thermoplasmata archaeon]